MMHVWRAGNRALNSRIRRRIMSYKEGRVGGGDGAVGLNEGWLQLSQCLWSGHADTIVFVHKLLLAVN